VSILKTLGKITKFVWREDRLFPVKFYNATNSIARFKDKKIISRFKNAVAYYKAGVVVVNLEF
jgi:hypothetical protein